MAELREKHLIVGPFPDPDPIDTALLFLRTNGYQVVVQERGAIPDELVVERWNAVPDEDEESDVEESDVEESDVEESDVEESDVEESDVEESDVEESDVEESDVEESDVEESDVEESDAEEEEEEEEQHHEEEPELPAEITIEVQVERGERGRGWFSSNMTELRTALTLRLDGNRIVVDYVVDTTGQRLWDEEREFWKREARAIEDYVLGDSSVVNILGEERARASEVRREFVVRGLWIGGVVAVVLFLILITLFAR